ncbi:creatininase family protein [Halovivax gelatinilyticus]|uniref:creatininase family protein n=1 Tax=Halovivax gelatinilyticus TaxID=2961597 RepID=UPI0020CA9364|nr:creatininase family protein [Halovivax gelatinilyticus]
MPTLATMTTEDAADAFESAAVGVLPTGSTEQHGPALPLGMDHLAAEAFASAVADRDDTIVLPTIPVGVSPHHMQFDGSLTVSEETFTNYVSETISSVAEHGLSKVVIVNGHGGNVSALSRAARELRETQVAYAPTWNWWDAVADLADELFDEVGGHADASESSLIWHLHEELVEPDALEDAEGRGADGWGKTVHGSQIGFDTIDFTESGAVGKPSQASPEKGAQLYEEGVAELEALLEWLADRSVEDCWQRSHR